MLLYHRQAGTQWSPLPTVVDRDAQAVIAASSEFGDFDLQAPLLCPGDRLEPDDSFDAALFAADRTARWERLIDIVEDEDWFQMEVEAGATLRVVVEVSRPDVTVRMEIYDRDGLTRLASGRGPGTLEWRADEAGSYFVRAAPETGSTIGCEAGYRLALSAQP
jgi:hypothetical protein